MIHRGGGADREAVRVLHVNDCAFVADRLLTAAHRRDLPWSFLPRAHRRPEWTGPVGTAHFAAAGARWLTRLAVGTARNDLRHLHSGAMLQHTRLVPGRRVLHLHGTDARTLLYRPQWQQAIRDGIRSADAVLYSTPDLAEHVLPLRPDAQWFPSPIDVSMTPRWADARREHDGGRGGGVFFASRWGGDKGVEVQLAVARRLRQTLPPQVRVLGLDWGPDAADAADAGVELLPRAAHAGYLNLLAAADVVVGQGTGILGISEYEALAVGAPLVMPLRRDLYGDRAPTHLGLGLERGPATPDGLVERVCDAVHAALADPSVAATAQDSREWAREHLDPDAAVNRLLALYAMVLGRDAS